MMRSKRLIALLAALILTGASTKMQRMRDVSFAADFLASPMLAFLRHSSHRAGRYIDDCSSCILLLCPGQSLSHELIAPGSSVQVVRENHRLQAYLSKALHEAAFAAQHIQLHHSWIVAVGTQRVKKPGHIDRPSKIYFLSRRKWSL